MKYKFFSVPAGDPLDAQQELNAFLGSHKIAAVEKSLVQDGMQSFWAICISYLENGKRSDFTHKSKVDYRNVFDGKDFVVFDKLRGTRKTMAEAEGVPPYTLFTNEQLATMVQTKVTTLSGLSAIDGIGKGRLEKYGKAILNVLKDEFATGEPVEAEQPLIESENETDQH